MKRQAKQELRGLTAKELRDRVESLRRELLDGRSKQAVEGERLGLQGRRLRRDIARCLTIINEQRNAQRTEVQG